MNASPLELPVVWRGEHGPQPLMTHLASLTFVNDREAAETYALEPNRRDDRIVAPRVIQAQLRMERPIFNSPDDPFVDFRDLAERVGFDTAATIFVRHQEDVMGTNAWEEVIQGRYRSVEAVLDQAPDLMAEPCVQIYPLLDDPMTLEAFRQAGFDGAIHASNGATMDAVEYRVFSSDQVIVVAIESLAAPEPKRDRRPRP